MCTEVNKNNIESTNKNDEVAECSKVDVENMSEEGTSENSEVNLPNEQTENNSNLLSSVQEVINVLSPSVATGPTATGKKHKKTRDNDKSVEKKISEANEKAKSALLGVYIKEEGLKQERQKPIMIAVMILLSAQLIFFNVLMFVLVLYGAKSISAEIFEMLLEFLKYYIGAVVVELIGLIVTITANTFSSQLSKNITKIFF